MSMRTADYCVPIKKRRRTPPMPRRRVSRCSGGTGASPTIRCIFFDNDAANFEGCDPSVVDCVKVSETSEFSDEDGQPSDSREKSLARTALGVRRFGEASVEARVLRQYCKMLLSMDDDQVFFDPKAGITQEQFSSALRRLQPSDLVILDFDRALTCIEGFMYPVHTWERYREGMLHLGMSDDIGVDDLIRTRLGGEERARMVARSLASLIGRVGASNVYVLTNNRCVALVEHVMSWLSALEPSAEPFAPFRVVSTKFTGGLGTKGNVIRALVEQTASGTIEPTLQRWRAEALTMQSA